MRMVTGGVKLENIQEFCYFGSMIENNGGIEEVANTEIEKEYNIMHIIILCICCIWE